MGSQADQNEKISCQADLAPCSTIGFKCGMKLPIKKQQVDWSVSRTNYASITKPFTRRTTTDTSSVTRVT